jgi:hypothetical protein
MNLKNYAAMLLLTALLTGCGEKKEQPKEASSEKAAEPESRVKVGTNGEVTVTVEGKLQKTIGLQAAALEAVQLSPEIKTYGRVLDISPLAALVAELATAEAAGQASQAELKRLKTLAEQNNTSERAVQSAQATAIHDQALIQSIRLRLMASWGAALAQRNDLPDFVQALGTLSSVLVQLDVAAGDVLTAAPAKARIFTLSDQNRPILASLIGPAATVDPQMQGKGVLYLVTPNSYQLVPGAAITGYLSLPGEPRSGVLLPRSAIVRFNGATWVYLQAAEEVFQRKEVTLENPLENGWFVSTGLKPQDKVVTIGCQQLLSEELKGQGQGD